MLEEKIENDFEFKLESNFDLASMAQDYMEFARKYHEQYLIKGKRSDLDNAVDNYIDAIKFNPNIAEAYYRLATLLWDKGEINLNSAIEQCKSAINISPENPNARIYAACFLEMAKNYDEAEKELKVAIKLEPFKSARSRLSLVSLYLDKMQEQKINAKDIYQSLYYLFSGSLSLAFDYPSLRMIYKNISKNFSLIFYDTLGRFWENTKNYAMAVKAYDKAAHKIGRDEIFYKKIGDLSVKEDSVATARECYLKALENNPNDKELLKKVAAITKEHFEDDINTALDCYTKLLALEADNANIYYEIGHLYLKKEDFINSINAFKLALEKDESNPFYHNALAYALVKAEQYDEACAHYKYAIEKNPDSEWTSIVCQALAALYHRIYDDIDSAVDMLERSILLDRKNDEAFVELGDIYMETEDLDSAIKSYCEAIKLCSTKASTFNKCAMALWQKDYTEEAIIACNKAINADCEYFAAYNNLGVIYLDGIRNLKEAKKLFKEAISIKRDYVMAHFNLGRVYKEQGEFVEAAKCFQTALELNEIEPELDSLEIRNKLYSLFDV